MKSNGSPSNVFRTLHVVFHQTLHVVFHQTLQRSILGMCTSKTDVKMLVMAEEKKGCLVWWTALLEATWYFSINFGWLLS